MCDVIKIHDLNATPNWIALKLFDGTVYLDKIYCRKF